MKISTLRMEFDPNTTDVDVWVKCSTREDCDALIAWLQLAKGAIKTWGEICAKAARASETAASKNEAPQRGKIQHQAQPQSGTNGINSQQANPLKDIIGA